MTRKLKRMWVDESFYKFMKGEAGKRGKPLNDFSKELEQELKEYYKKKKRKGDDFFYEYRL